MAAPHGKEQCPRWIAQVEEALSQNGLQTLSRILPKAFLRTILLWHTVWGSLGIDLGSAGFDFSKFLDDVSDEDIVKLEIPTGAPIHYIFNKDGAVIKKQNLMD